MGRIFNIIAWVIVAWLTISGWESLRDWWSPPTEEVLAERAGQRALRKQRDAGLAVERAKREEGEAKQQADEAAKCRKDVVCWGDRNSLSAALACRPAVESMAKFQHEWTDGMLEPKFSHYRWKNADKGVVTYIGDKVKFQNGFGAWQHQTYLSDFDTQAKVVLDVKLKPGRI